ncbi:tRNA uracil 4-sulfurtransferase ThiI [Mammaliicoccus sciuri]|uniref:tRNA uracil 4-sulfurtransferase ThiI n=1 Tax=Mammaliicoccus sciuri TaxID=1296 RepID=UPI000E69825D|nr:tRNA uracil 4-sulfurtransferase ThiI [Mammaliicoccus sciuri]RIO11776.1 tRNA 4-thiouridine(8) synthase ThiI [Mammaliicoccus sciuri]RIO17487.1 tRNA 4-thiouridine(8) synthase ThiI [Mammaliicoccus sciuri]
MNYDHILVRYGELTLKTGNRNMFVNKLKANIKSRLMPLQGYKVRANRDRMYIDVQEGSDIEEMMSRIQTVFGVHSVSPVVRIEKDLDLMKEVALKFAHDFKDGDTFKIDVKRADKTFELDTFQLQQELGGHVLQNTDHITVNVKQPDHKIKVEVRKDAIYMYNRVLEGAGGLPVGTGGKTLLMLSGGIDSPVAGMEVMKRGVTIEAIHFHSPPYTSEQAKQKVIDLTKQLAHLTGDIKLHIVPFTELQKQIHKVVEESFTMTSTRRMMLRVTEKVAHEIGAHAIVNGENLGQVASQTLGSMYAINSVTSMPILRPLLTFDKEDIVKKAKAINTFDLSIQPFEDCCTIFTPKNPKTNPKLEKVEYFESKFDFGPLIDEAVKNVETLTISKHDDLNQQKDEWMDELL